MYIHTYAYTYTYTYTYTCTFRVACGQRCSRSYRIGSQRESQTLPWSRGRPSVHREAVQMKKKRPVRVDHEGAGHLCALNTRAQMQIPSVGKLDASVPRRERRLAASTHCVARLEGGECLCRSRGPVSAAILKLWRTRGALHRPRGHRPGPTAPTPAGARGRASPARTDL